LFFNSSAELFILSIEFLIIFKIFVTFLACSFVDSASFLTSSATTAKPFPDFPA